MIYAPWATQEYSRRVQWKSYGQGVNIFEPCVILKPEVISLGDGCRVDAFVKIAGGEGVTLGENVHLASFCHINAGSGTVVMGRGSGCASHVVICGGMTDIAMLATTPQDGNVAKRMVTVIGQYVCIFAGAIICPGITIGDGAIVGAGSVVTKDVEPWTVVAGNPTRFIKMRETMVGA